MKIIEEGTTKEIWAFIETQLEERVEPYANLDALYEFQLTDETDGDGVYQLCFHTGVAKVRYSSEEKADCILKMKTKYFKRLLLGELNSTAAFMTGRISVKGNITLALKLESLLKKYSFE